MLSVAVNASQLSVTQNCVVTPQLEVTDLFQASVKLKLVIKLQLNSLG